MVLNEETFQQFSYSGEKQGFYRIKCKRIKIDESEDNQIVVSTELKE